MGAVVDMSVDSERQPFFDKSTFPSSARFARRRAHRTGGSSIATAAISARGSLHAAHVHQRGRWWTMAPWWIRTPGGKLAQVGKHCHISAASQIGGVLEPVGAMPVIVEDDVLVGGNLRHLRRHHRQAPRRARHRNHPQSLHPRLRPGSQHRPPRHGDDPLVIPEAAVW